MILKIFSPKILANNWRLLLKIELNYAKKLIISLFVFYKNAFFGRKLPRIAENCDHNIDPWHCRLD
jgi:hypothetical protein